MSYHIHVSNNGEGDGDGDGDGDGYDYENVTEKLMSRCIKLYRAYSNSFNSSNLGNFFWS